MAAESKLTDLTWLGRSSRSARYVGRPFRRFISVEAAGGVVLLIATITALVWANSPWKESYFDLWFGDIHVSVGDVEIFIGPVEAFVNDALMAIFFFVVGLEIKRELVTGSLKNRRDALLPVIAAVGGMVVPALIYAVLNWGTDAVDGWAIPMATDIAFAIGVVSLLGSRVPKSLKVFLLTLAIVDDIGAILVIAIFYTSELSWPFLILAVVLLVFMWVMQKMRVWYIPAYIAVGAVVWWATYRSGVHATIAGVAIGLLTPAKPLQSEEDARQVAKWLQDKGQVFIADVRYAGFRIRESKSVAERLETLLHPYTSFLIIPIFALANAGVELSTDILTDALESPVTMGIVFGLVIGKTVGVFGFTLIGLKTKVAQLPRMTRKAQILGIGMVAGIGFTVSIFVTTLAFPTGDHGHSEEAATELVDGNDGELLQTAQNRSNSDEAKIGILVGSMIAASMGLATLYRTCPRKRDLLGEGPEQSETAIDGA
jgi:NhaA family Na+:H+ antiporter